MKVDGKHFQTIWIEKANPLPIKTIDQRLLPFQFKTIDLKTPDDVYNAIKNMIVRGAPLIGVTAAYGVYLAILNYNKEANFDEYMKKIAEKLKSARPTAINLEYAVNRVLSDIEKKTSQEEKLKCAFHSANQLKEMELQNSMKIGEYGLKILKETSKKNNGKPVNILTHCNAGWLACIDYGTATAPIYMAHDLGINIHVWIDETRPRNQGARLTVWELKQHGVPCTLIPDNTGGLLMQKGLVDLVIVGSDRTSINGDVANKIGTYLKALAAKDNNIPFYAALPSSSIDWDISDGLMQIPIEERDENEVKKIEGLWNNQLIEILITDDNIPVRNYGFDVTPSKLITGLITERGICKANKDDIYKLFPEKLI